MIMKRIDNIANGFVAPLLKENRFKKKKLAWNRVRKNFIDVIEIDELRGSTTGNERFVINVAVFVPAFFKITWDQEPKNFVQDADALLRLRLEDFWDEMFSTKLTRTWIDLDSDELSSAGQELVRLLDEKVLPYFDAIEDFDDLEKCFEHSKSRHKEYSLAQIQYALLKHQNGFIDEANNILQSLASGKNKAWASRAQSVLSRI